MDNEILLKTLQSLSERTYLYLYSLCGDRHLAEDLLHETFLKALLALPDGHANMRAWLYMVARNLFYNQWKKNSRKFLWRNRRITRREKQTRICLKKFSKKKTGEPLSCNPQTGDKETGNYPNAVFWRNVAEEIAAVYISRRKNVRVLAYRPKRSEKNIWKRRVKNDIS